MCLLSLTAPDSNLGAVYLSSFRFHVKRVDNAVRFPVLRSGQFWWFHILSHSQCRPFSWVGVDNTFDFSKGGRGLGAVYLTNRNLSDLLQRWSRIWKKVDHFPHFFKEYLCAETKEIKRKAFATIVTKWTKTFILEKLFVSAKNIWNKVLCIIVIEDLDDN